MYTFVDLQCVNKQIWQAMFNEVFTIRVRKTPL